MDRLIYIEKIVRLIFNRWKIEQMDRWIDEQMDR